MAVDNDRSPLSEQDTIRLATWNLDRPAKKGIVRNGRIKSKLQQIAADIWVLTETRTDFAAGTGFQAIHSTMHPDRREGDERWVSIWSRWPTEPVNSDEWSATAKVETPTGAFLVHGLVLPYMHEPGIGGMQVGAWTRFREMLAQQSNLWVDLRTAYASIPLVLAGDFNQSLGRSHWYGSPADRERLLDAFTAANVRCLTADLLAESRKFGMRPLVDHICVSNSVICSGVPVCWEPITAEGAPISDHPGVAVDLAIQESGRHVRSPHHGD